MASKIAVKAQRSPSRKVARRRPAAISSSNPLYVQVALALKKDIVDGVYPVGAHLPTEDALCARFSVSRYTVREALRRLREDNLVSSRQGAGTIVVPGYSAGTYAQDVISINDLVSSAVGRRFAIQYIQMVQIDDELALRSGLDSGEQWLVARGFGQMEDAESPFCWAEYFIHRDYAAIGRLLPRHTGPVFPLIEDLFGQTIVEVHQEIGATLISPALAHSLKVDAGTAGLEVRRTYKTPEGKVAQVTISIHPASLFRHSMMLRRVKR